ncbi:efflux RND transporter periplasmic adaptor subunit [Achromobacter sp. GG226]|nr:efflux RND transporter periplasmic adaptor subunit [Verticiella sp. GG226]
MGWGKAVVVGVLGIVVAAAVWQSRRGPEVPAYALVQAPLVQSVVASGRVVATVRARIGSEVAGTVRLRRVDEGDRVAAGDVLAELDDGPAQARVAEARAALAQLAQGQRPQAQSALRQAEIEAAQAEREARRRQGLQASGAFSREEVELASQARDAARARLAQARTQAATLAPGEADERVLLARLAQAESDLARTTLRASFAGLVVSQDAEPGDVVQPGQVLFDLARDGDTEILLPVDEKNLARLALAQRAVVIADAYPESPFPARVTRIAPGVDTQRGTVEVRLMPDATPDFLREDMTVSVTIETARRDEALAIPNDTLRAARPGEPATVLVVRDGRAQRAPVTLGLRGLTLTEVREGLTAGDVVLARPDFAPDTRVRPVLEPLPVAARARNGG